MYDSFISLFTDEIFFYVQIFTIICFFFSAYLLIVEIRKKKIIRNTIMDLNNIESSCSVNFIQYDSIDTDEYISFSYETCFNGKIITCKYKGKIMNCNKCSQEMVGIFTQYELYLECEKCGKKEYFIKPVWIEED